MGNKNIRIILADDHDIVRSGLRRLLESKPGFEVVAEVESGEQAYQCCGELDFDVIVMDLSMPGMGGMEAARKIIARYPEAKILIFSMHENTAFASQALKTGVKGYVTKTGVSSDLVKAIQEISEGKIFLSADIAQKIAVQVVIGNDEPIHQLSAREFELFRMLAEGQTIEVIADRFNISQKTVANNLTMIKQKLNVSTPIEMLRLAIRHNLLV